MSTAPRTFALAGLAVATVLLSGCSPVAGAPSASAPVPSAAAEAGVSSTIPAAEAAVIASPGNPAPGAPTGGAQGKPAPGKPAQGRPAQGKPGQGKPGQAQPVPSAAPAARIDSLRVVTAPTCPVVGTPDAPFSSPGHGVTIAWAVTGANGAALAVDNPGVYGAYGSYPASGRLTLSFPCDSAGTTTHRYTVWPAGAEGVSKTLTVSAHAGA